MRFLGWIPWIGAAAVLALAGCSKGDGADSTASKSIGVSLLTREHQFYRDLEKAMRDEAARLGYALRIASAEFKSSEQANQVENFVTSRVDAIVVCPCDSAGIGGVLAEANRAGIPIFTADIAASTGEVVCHIASDNVAGGRQAAAFLASAIGGDGEVVVIDHPEVTSVIDRVRGFEEEMKKHPGIRIVDRPAAGGQRERALKVMEDMLQAHPNVKGVFGINDNSALGALAAVEAAGRSDISIVGYDATPDARAAIRRGSALKADTVQYPDRIGATTIRMIHDHLAGKPVPKIVPVEVGIVDRASLEKAGEAR